MKFNPFRLATAATVTVFACYSICSLLTLYYPEHMRNMIAALWYLPRIEELIPHWEMSWANYMSGSLQMIAWTFVFTFAFAWMYNWLLGTEKGKK